MAGSSLLVLLDDIAAVLDDVALMTKVAAKKTAGVLGDDLAVNAEKVSGVRADRELPVVWAVAKGSFRNKFILVPAALAMSWLAPWLITPVLILGGLYLCYEGFEKLVHTFLYSKEEDAAHHEDLLEHLADPMGALVRIRRLLRPGGFLYLDTPNIAKYTRRLKLLFGRFPSTASRDEGLTTYDGQPVDLHDEGHLHYFTYRSLSRLLVERCGFSSVEKLPYFTGGRLLGARGDHALACAWPQLFAELCVVARV